MQNYSIAFEYKLKVAKAVNIGGVATFVVESDFIPVETYQIPVSTDLGTINGQSLGHKNLIKVFDMFENIALLDQSIFQMDMNDFVLPPGNFIPEPSVATTINLSVNDYVLYYLQKNQ